MLENLKPAGFFKWFEEITRIPHGSGHEEKIATFLASLKNIVKVRVLAYHNYAGAKYDALGMENTMPATLPTPEELENAKETLSTITKLPISD